MTREKAQTVFYNLFIIRNMVIHYYPLFSQLPSFIHMLSRSVFPSMVLMLYHQQVDLTIFCECMTLFITITKNLSHLFKKELELFFEKVVFHYLGNISVFHQIDRYLMEKLLLESLLEILNESLALEKLYRNYDCDVYALNVVSILYSIVGLISCGDL